MAVGMMCSSCVYLKPFLMCMLGNRRRIDQKGILEVVWSNLLLGALRAVYQHYMRSAFFCQILGSPAWVVKTSFGWTLPVLYCCCRDKICPHNKQWLGVDTSNHACYLALQESAAITSIVHFQVVSQKWSILGLILACISFSWVHKYPVRSVAVLVVGEANAAYVPMHKYHWLWWGCECIVNTKCSYFFLIFSIFRMSFFHFSLF